MSDLPPPLEALPPPADFHSPINSVRHEATYDFYGAFSSARLAASATSFVLAHCGIGDAAGVAGALSAFLADAAAHARRPDREGAAAAAAAWLCVRLTTPTDAWVTPRWHRDGRMFQCACAPVSPHAKYAVALRGPPTRLVWPSEAVDAAVRGVEACRGDGGEEEEEEEREVYAREDREREQLAAALEGMPLVEVRPGQVVRFTWGADDAPVHSEPDCSAEDRVFVSVMFGSEEELRDMCRIRDATYGVESVWISPRSST